MCTCMKSVLVSAVSVKVQCFFSQRAANLTHSGQFMNFDPAAPDQAFMSYWYGAVPVRQKGSSKKPATFGGFLYLFRTYIYFQTLRIFQHAQVFVWHRGVKALHNVFSGQMGKAFVSHGEVISGLSGGERNDSSGLVIIALLKGTGSSME